MRFVFALLAVCATTVSAQACGFMGQPPCYPGSELVEQNAVIKAVAFTIFPLAMRNHA